ncbi:L,D-transpeptidase [Mesorhizobium sp. SB112]|uniref:L,D-transpeptidase n=1 Tax=Mesorhizobium sp. SB112 TaxID=3151853 RepID=UPI0032639D38
MRIRSLVFLGICAMLGMSSVTYAEAPTKTYLFPSKADRAAAEKAKATEAQKPGSKKLSEKATRAEQRKAAAAAKAKKEAAAFAKAVPMQAPTEVAARGNNGELRSEQRGQPVRPAGGLFAGLFGGAIKPQQPRMLPQTQALDAVLEQKQAAKRFNVKADFLPQSVPFSGYKPGTIVVDTQSRYLYLVESSRSARRYAIAVGKEGLEFKGAAVVGDKQEWPRWIPTADMQKREPKKYGQYKDGMNGGPENPLGARAIYLYQGKKDTHIRIHGTNQPQTIGTNSSNGCFRMVNDHVMDLYSRVKMGTEVVVM